MNWKLFAATAVTSLVFAGNACVAQAEADTSAAGRSEAPAQAAAAKTATPSRAATHQMSGTVVSSDANNLVISHKFSGKLQNMAFALNPETKTSGKIERGALMTVMYRVEGGKNIALNVRVRSATQVPHLE